MPGVLLWGWDSVNKVWREVIVDSSGRINIGSVADAEISQDTPQSLKHVPHGYYAAGPSYLPLAVNSEGKLLLQTAALDHLDDIGDVSVPTPTDGYVLYWDAATSLWKCKAHTELTTGVHGAIADEDILVAAISRSNFVMIPTNAGWGTSHTGSGGANQDPTRLNIYTGTTASSRGLLYATNYGFCEGFYYSRINWDKKLVIVINIGRYNSDSECIARFQLKSVGTEGVLAARGIGIKVLNYALWGESYGTSLGEVDLSTTLTGLYQYQMKIVFNPASSIQWYVNGVLKGTQSTAATIPSGTIDNYLIASIINGATGGVNAMWSLMQGKIWQAR